MLQRKEVNKREEILFFLMKGKGYEKDIKSSSNYDM